MQSWPSCTLGAGVVMVLKGSSRGVPQVVPVRTVYSRGPTAKGTTSPVYFTRRS